MKRLLRRFESMLRRKILEWLLKDGLPELRVGSETMVITGNYIDFALLTANPTGVEGRLCYNTTDKKARFYDGVSWRDLW